MAVFRIETRHENGDPESVSIVRPEDVAELSKSNPEKNCFIIGYLPRLDHSEHAGELTY